MYGLVLATLAAGGLIAAGAALRGKRVENARGVLLSALGISLAAVFLGGVLALSATSASAAEATAAASGAAGWAFLGAGLATGLACIGAGVAVGGVGSAALGVVSEKPEMLGMTLIYLGLAEGIAIYGIIISLLLLGRV